MPKYNEAPHKCEATRNSLIGPFHFTNKLTIDVSQADEGESSALILLCPSSRFQLENWHV